MNEETDKVYNFAIKYVKINIFAKIVARLQKIICVYTSSHVRSNVPFRVDF